MTVGELRPRIVETSCIPVYCAVECSDGVFPRLKSRDLTAAEWRPEVCEGMELPSLNAVTTSSAHDAAERKEVRQNITPA